jgi:hypothetical protein
MRFEKKIIAKSDSSGTHVEEGHEGFQGLQRHLAMNGVPPATR